MNPALDREWDLLATLSTTRDGLRPIRSVLWQRSLLTTTEHLHVDKITVEPWGWRPDPGGDVMWFEVAIVTSLPDGHDVTSSISLLIGPEGWHVESEVSALNDSSIILWRGVPETGEAPADLDRAMRSAAERLVLATLDLDVLAADSPSPG